MPKISPKTAVPGKRKKLAEAEKVAATEPAISVIEKEREILSHVDAESRNDIAPDNVLVDEGAAVVQDEDAGATDALLTDDNDDGEKIRRPDRYFEGVGRRKTAVARVRLYTKAGDFAVNGKEHHRYFPTQELQSIAEDSLKKMKLLGRFRVSVKMSGGGSHAQAEALRHGLARCLVKFNPDFRKRLRRAGFLTRDSRMKERKKFGLKKARKAPQWAKR